MDCCSCTERYLLGPQIFEEDKDITGEDFVVVSSQHLGIRMYHQIRAVEKY